MTVGASQESGYRDALALIGAGSIARFAGVVVSALLGVASTALAVRLLGISSYGVLAFSLAFVNLVTAAARLGVGARITQEVASLSGNAGKGDVGHTARAALTLTTLSGLVGSIVLVVMLELAPTVQREQPGSAFSFGLALLLFGALVATTGSSIARGRGRMAMMEVLPLSVRVGRFGSIAILGGLGAASLQSVALGYGLAGAGSAVISAVFLRRLVPAARRLFVPALGAARRLLIASVPYATMGLATVVIARFDVLILGFAREGTEVGVYEPTLRLSHYAVILFLTIFSAPLLPAATSLWTKGNGEGLRNLYLTVAKLSYILSIPAVIIFVAFPEPVLRAIYGSDFPVRLDVVRVLVAGFMITMATGHNGGMVAATGEGKKMMTISFTGLAGMVISALLLIPPFGVMGAAVATSLAYLMLNIASGIVLFRLTGVHPFQLKLPSVVVTSLIPIGLALLLREWVQPTSLWLASLCSLAVWAVWLAFLHITGTAHIGRLTSGMMAFRSAKGLK